VASVTTGTGSTARAATGPPSTPSPPAPPTAPVPRRGWRAMARGTSARRGSPSDASAAGVPTVTSLRELALMRWKATRLKVVRGINSAAIPGLACTSRQSFERLPLRHPRFRQRMRPPFVTDPALGMTKSWVWFRSGSKGSGAARCVPPRGQGSPAIADQSRRRLAAVDRAAREP